MSARPAAAGRNGRKGCSETGISGGSDALRLGLPPSRRAKAPLRRDGAAHSRAPKNRRGSRRFPRILIWGPWVARRNVCVSDEGSDMRICGTDPFPDPFLILIPELLT